MLLIGRELGIEYVIAGAFFLPVSLLVIWKTTRNYFARHPTEENRGS